MEKLIKSKENTKKTQRKHKESILRFLPTRFFEKRVMPCLNRLIMEAYHGEVLGEVKEYYRKIKIKDGKSTLPGLPSYLEIKEAIKRALLDNPNSDIVKPMEAMKVFFEIKKVLAEIIGYLPRNPAIPYDDGFLENLRKILQNAYPPIVLKLNLEYHPDQPFFIEQRRIQAEEANHLDEP